MNLLSQLRDTALALESGAKFPTIRELMARHGVTQYAVQTALKTLNEEGVLESHVGKGTRVAFPQAFPNGRKAESNLRRVLLLHHHAHNERGDHVAEAVQDQLTQVDCRVISVAYGNEEDLVSLMGEGQFDLCIVQPRLSSLSTGLLELAKRSARHIVVEGKNMEGMDFDIVARNPRASMRLAIRHLNALDHNRLGLVCENREGMPQENDFEQIFDFLSEVTSVPKAEVFRRRANLDGADEAAPALQDVLAEWKSLSADIRPTALIVWGRFPAAKIREILAENDIKVPQDLSLLRICSTSVPSLHDGFFTTVGRSAESIAQAVCETAEWRMTYPDAAPLVTMSMPQIITHSSTARRTG